MTPRPTPRFSAAVERIADSAAVAAVLRLAERPDLLSLAGGLPDSRVFLPERTRETMHRVLTDHAPEALNYSPNPGVTALREYLAARMERIESVPTTTEEVIVTSGGVEAIRHSVNTLCDPGDALLVEDPTYVSALQICRALDVVPVPVAADADGPLPEALLEATRRPAPSGRAPAVLYVGPTFQNPSGRTWPLARRRAILEVCDRADLTVIEDHAYGELHYDAAPPPPLKALLPERVVFVHTFSKIFGPGLRLGWAVADPEIVRRLGLLKLGTDQCSGALVQRLALAYGESGAIEEQVLRARGLYREKRDRMFAAARDLPTRVPVVRPGGGFFLWADFGAALDTRALLPAAIEERRVAFVAGSVFHADPDSPAARGTMRLSFSQIPRESIPEAMARLEAAVRSAAAA